MHTVRIRIGYKVVRVQRGDWAPWLAEFFALGHERDWACSGCAELCIAASSLDGRSHVMQSLEGRVWFIVDLVAYLQADARVVRRVLGPNSSRGNGVCMR